MSQTNRKPFPSYRFGFSIQVAFHLFRLCICFWNGNFRIGPYVRFFFFACLCVKCICSLEVLWKSTKFTLILFETPCLLCWNTHTLGPSDVCKNRVFAYERRFYTGIHIQFQFRMKNKLSSLAAFNGKRVKFTHSSRRTCQNVGIDFH